MPETDDGADVPYDPDIDRETALDLDDDGPDWYDDAGIEGEIDHDPGW